MKALLASLALAMMAHSAGSAAAGDAVAGQSKVAVCLACHGPEGNSFNPEWPKLAGQHAEYTVKQLKNLQAGEGRTNLIMAPMVATLSDQDIEDIAAYYETRAPTGGYAEANLVEQGEKLYRGGNLESGVAACAGCHGPDGAGSPLGGFPALAGQHATYVDIQLKAFRSGERTNDKAEMMQDIARWMTDDEMAAVSQYIAGLH